jgi:uncharacterized integral membrane protein
MSEQRTLLQKIRLWVMIALGVVVLIVVFQNLDSQETQILAWKFQMPQAALIFGSLAIGFGLGTLRRRR